MKIIRKMLVLLICGLFLCQPVFAAGEQSGDDEAYTYTISVYSGKEGYFGSEDRHVIRFDGLEYGQEISLNLRDMDLKLVDGDKYYARGLKIAGHDNDEISRYQYVTYSFKVTGDESFSVAYGMKGGMVKYTVRYVDENGSALLPDEEYYGMAGDYPVVSYHYIEGYQPASYNLGKTLTDNEADNVFTFNYSRVSGENNGQGAAGNTGNGTGNAAGNGAGTGAGANAADGTATGDNETPAVEGPADFTDLDDNETPTVDDPGVQDQGSSELARQLLSARLMAGLCAVLIIAIIAIIVVILMRRRRKSEEQSEE